MKAAILPAVWCLVAAPFARAGVTIHFKGEAKSAEDLPKILAAATSYAKSHGWTVEDASADEGELVRPDGAKVGLYEGKITGVVLQPHNMSEPVWLQFGDDLVFADHVKTQFAGAETHVAIIEMFDALKPLLKSLTIEDEGEYFTTRDREVLENHFAQVRESLRQLKREEPAMYGPIKLKDGRIVDMIR